MKFHFRPNDKLTQETSTSEEGHLQVYLGSPVPSTSGELGRFSQHPDHEELTVPQYSTAHSALSTKAQTSGECVLEQLPLEVRAVAMLLASRV